MNRRGRRRHPDILTPREWEVLSLIQQGKSNEEISEQLAVSLATAKYHVSEILGKLGVESRHEAARWSRSRLPALALPLTWARELGQSSKLIAAASISATAVLVAALAWGVAITERSDSKEAVEREHIVAATPTVFAITDSPAKRALSLPLTDESTLAVGDRVDLIAVVRERTSVVPTVIACDGVVVAINEPDLEPRPRLAANGDVLVPDDIEAPQRHAILAVTPGEYGVFTWMTAMNVRVLATLSRKGSSCGGSAPTSEGTASTPGETPTPPALRQSRAEGRPVHMPGGLVVTQLAAHAGRVPITDENQLGELLATKADTPLKQSRCAFRRAETGVRSEAFPRLMRSWRYA